MTEFFLLSLLWAAIVLAAFTVILVIADWWIMHQGLKRWEEEDDD